MRKALRIVVLLVVTIILMSACTCSKMKDSEEWRAGGEKVSVEAAIEGLMHDNGITDLSKYSDNSSTAALVRTFDAGEATNDMTIFPSTVWPIYPGYSRVATTKLYYTVENDGTVRQFSDPAKSEESNAE
jgi:hypothetical protein